MKLECKSNYNWTNTFINIHRDELSKLEYNNEGYTTIKITKQLYIFNFPTRMNEYRRWLSDNIINDVY